jgi:hypothetical protein
MPRLAVGAITKSFDTPRIIRANWREFCSFGAHSRILMKYCLRPSFAASSVLLLLLITVRTEAKQPARITLDPNGTSTISLVFDTTGWAPSDGSSLHTGDDDFAQDWSRSAGTTGQNTYAAITGKVTRSYLSSSTLGNTVVIHDASSGFAVRYAHLQTRFVQEGDDAVAGVTLIGLIGSSGPTPTPHLHIALYKNVFPPYLACPSSLSVLGRPMACLDLEDSNSPYAATFVFTPSRLGPAPAPPTLRLLVNLLDSFGTS